MRAVLGIEEIRALNWRLDPHTTRQVALSEFLFARYTLQKILNLLGTYVINAQNIEIPSREHLADSTGNRFKNKIRMRHTQRFRNHKCYSGPKS